MNIKETFGAVTLALTLVGGTCVVASAQNTAVAAPEQKATPQKNTNVAPLEVSGQDAKAKSVVRPRSTAASPQTNDAAQAKGGAKASSPASTPAAAPEEPEASDAKAAGGGIPADALTKRREQTSESQAAIEPYYNNFFTDYRIGPEDVISIHVFGQERYSVANIIVPPDGLISHPLIPEGVFVVGKTRQQVQAELVKRLDEYIIDPKVTVSLDKSVSYRYSVLGDVAQPGIRLMGRRLTAYQAIAEAGGILNTGDKKKVYILRSQANGVLAPLPINIAAIERGKLADTIYLVPGDQVIVPGNSFKRIDQVLKYLPVLSFARIFTGGF